MYLLFGTFYKVTLPSWGHARQLLIFSMDRYIIISLRRIACDYCLFPFFLEPKPLAVCFTTVTLPSLQSSTRKEAFAFSCCRVLARYWSSTTIFGSFLGD